MGTDCWPDPLETFLCSCIHSLRSEKLRQWVGCATERERSLALPCHAALQLTTLSLLFLQMNARQENMLSPAVQVSANRLPAGTGQRTGGKQAKHPTSALRFILSCDAEPSWTAGWIGIYLLVVGTVSSPGINLIGAWAYPGRLRWSLLILFPCSTHSILSLSTTGNAYVNDKKILQLIL